MYDELFLHAILDVKCSMEFLPWINFVVCVVVALWTIIIHARPTVVGVPLAPIRGTLPFGKYKSTNGTMSEVAIESTQALMDCVRGCCYRRLKIGSRYVTSA